MTATLDAPASPDAIARALSDHERRCLRRAFQHLSAGDVPGFHYALWVGFAGTWHAVRDALIRAGYVDVRRGDVAGPTERTPEFLRSIDAPAP